MVIIMKGENAEPLENDTGNKLFIVSYADSNSLIKLKQLLNNTQND